MQSRFTPLAIQVVQSALTELDRRGDAKVMPEHLLVGLLQLDEGVAVEVLDVLAVDRRELGECVGGLGGSHHPHPGRISADFDRDAQLATQAAAEYVERHGLDYISSGALLLGLAHRSDTVAGKALSALGCDATTIESALLDLDAPEGLPPVDRTARRRQARADAWIRLAVGLSGAVSVGSLATIGAALVHFESPPLGDSGGVLPFSMGWLVAVGVPMFGVCLLFHWRGRVWRRHRPTPIGRCALELIALLIASGAPVVWLATGELWRNRAYLEPIGISVWVAGAVLVALAINGLAWALHGREELPLFNDERMQSEQAREADDPRSEPDTKSTDLVTPKP